MQGIFDSEFGFLELPSTQVKCDTVPSKLSLD